MLRERVLVGCFAAFGLSAFGHGQGLIDVAFGTGDATPVGAAFYGSGGDQWNEVIANGSSTGALPVFNVAGSATSVTVNLTAEGSILSAITNTQPLPDLTNYYAFNNAGGTIEADIEGLSANTLYDVALYVASDDGVGGDRGLIGTVNGANGFSATGIPQSSFVNGQNLVLLAVESDSNGNLDIIESNPGNLSNEVDFNGFQIQQATPEPVSLSVLGLGIGALIRRKRRA